MFSSTGDSSTKKPGSDSTKVERLVDVIVVRYCSKTHACYGYSSELDSDVRINRSLYTEDILRKWVSVRVVVIEGRARASATPTIIENKYPTRTMYGRVELLATVQYVGQQDNRNVFKHEYFGTIVDLDTIIEEPSLERKYTVWIGQYFLRGCLHKWRISNNQRIVESGTLNGDDSVDPFHASSSLGLVPNRFKDSYNVCPLNLPHIQRTYCSPQLVDIDPNEIVGKVVWVSFAKIEEERRRFSLFRTDGFGIIEDRHSCVKNVTMGVWFRGWISFVSVDGGPSRWIISNKFPVEGPFEILRPLVPNDQQPGTSHSDIASQDEKNDFQSCLTQLQENLESLLKPENAHQAKAPND